MKQLFFPLMLFSQDIEVPEYNHFDYAIAVDCAEKVFNPITRIVRSQESGMCER